MPGSQGPQDGLPRDVAESGADISAWIGRERTIADVVTPRLLGEFGATFAPHGVIPRSGEAPPGFHWCLAPDVSPADALGADGHAAKGGFLPPVDLPRRMWAGGTVETLDVLEAWDRITRREQIQDVSFKTGRSGRLCFVKVLHEIATERGIAVREQVNIVYREAAPPAAGPAAAPVAARDDAYDIVVAVPATPTLLFRYSALTFNGHRIHYDHPYATQVEGYADLVVHGPIQATLLFNLAARMGGRVPASFRCRGLAPMTANQTFRVCGRKTGSQTFEGITLDAQGRVCMEADAQV